MCACYLLTSIPVYVKLECTSGTHMSTRLINKRIVKHDGKRLRNNDDNHVTKRLYFKKNQICKTFYQFNAKRLTFFRLPDIYLRKQHAVSIKSRKIQNICTFVDHIFFIVIKLVSLQNTVSIYRVRLSEPCVVRCCFRSR